MALRRIDCGYGDGETYRIREIVQVSDPTAFRWIVGTATGSCVRLGTNVDAATLVLHVTEAE